MSTFLRFFLVFSFGVLFACQSSTPEIPSNVQLALPSGKILQTKLALTLEEQTQGLSGVSKDQFQKDQAMLFVYSRKGTRAFWMPDTYFNLDIFFLDDGLKVLSLERNLAAHPGYHEPPKIQRTKAHMAQHVLELRSDSPLAREIKVGTSLRWISSVTLSQIISNIRLQQ